MGSTIIAVRHNIEVAHRLYETPGKCNNIHGHSMWVTLTLSGPVSENGMVASIDFEGLKALFRQRLDGAYDHHLLLNRHDDLTRLDLPGVSLFMGDPTTEHIAEEIYDWAYHNFGELAYEVKVEETAVNSAIYRGEGEPVLALGMSS